MKKLLSSLLVVILLIAVFILRTLAPEGRPINQVVPTPIATPTGEPAIEAVATNLEIPWEIAFLPDGRIILTERPGRVRILDTVTHEIDDVAHIGEGGLMGLALHPNFERNSYIYFYYTYREGGQILNKVVRYTLRNSVLQPDKVIIDNIPGSTNHDGGRIKFGLEGKLYITTGDAGNPGLSQDTNSLAGKILRLNEDGSIPSDNPFGNAVWSWGHRNPQGLAWDSNGQLWITEHGPTAFDEINKIEPGENYGWPEIKGDQQEAGMKTPFLHSKLSTWAPSGAIVKDNLLYFAGLRGGSIFKLDLETREITRHFSNRFGRIRTITLGPDGFFYILTSNRDGRGSPIAEDDRIIKVHPTLLE